MSGAWEIGPKVLCAILHTENTTMAWSLGFRNLVIPGPVLPLAGMPFDMARNAACMVALEQDCSHLFFLDSVPEYTPVLIRKDGLVDCIPICDIAAFQGNDKEYIELGSSGIEVFVGEYKGSWTPIRHILRHPFDGELYRINTHSGVVDVSANHSVMGVGNVGSIAGEDVRVGMTLSMPHHRGRDGREKRFFFGTPELAWFYGFFAAEGSASGTSVHVDNNNVVFLQRCQDIFKMFFGKDLAIHTASRSNREVETKRVGTSGRRIYDFFRSKFYNSLGQKKVPSEILNGPEPVKRQFLQGYYDGDGHLSGGKWQSFSTNSPTLALGIQWLLQTATRQKYTVHIRPDKLNIIGIAVNQEDSQAKRPSAQRRNPGYVKKVCKIPYHGFLYDIETEKHVFAGGVGPILLHNSDVIPPHDSVIRLLNHRLPIVSGLYCRRSPPHGVPVMMKPVGNWITRFRMNSLVEVETVGAGCLLISRDVLQKLPPQSPQYGRHWFDWRVDQKSLATPDRLPLSEDFTFNQHAKKFGFKTYVDTSIRCRHVGLAQAEFGSLLPCEATPNT